MKLNGIIIYISATSHVTLTALDRAKFYVSLWLDLE